MVKLLVVGGASLDTLHLQNRTYHSAGGAGMYTSMAAIRCGVSTSMFAPKPEPMPDELKEIEKRLDRWFGPAVKPADLPHFEIEHCGEKAHYLHTSIGAESLLRIYQLPADLGKFDCIHFTPLGDSDLQFQFIHACRQKGTRLISAGTYLCMIKEKRLSILQSLEIADVFFMNEEEACLIFGSSEKITTKPGKLLFVTMGEKGCLVVQGSHRTFLKSIPSQVFDPTGAGDSFCGATLAALLQGEHPVMAAQKGMALATEEIREVGPKALLKKEHAPAATIHTSVRLNHKQIEKISRLVSKSSAASPSDFTGKDFPPAFHPKTLDYFFATILQQFSFWEEKDDHYDHPLIATIDGDNLKGSAYLFRACVRLLDSDPDFYSPERQASLTLEDLQQLFKADDGSDPMPALKLHHKMAVDYGRDMLATGKTPQGILALAKASSTPLKTFLHELDQIGGYKEDPLRKKSNLLALVLNQRPEAFLNFGEDESVPPVIDYHTMRSCLRMGLVEILDEKLKEKIEARKTVTEDEEWAIRYACYLAVEDVVRISGKSLRAVDWFFFYYSRQHCPEMTEPVCGQCAANEVCAHRKSLFQPVMRTTYY